MILLFILINFTQSIIYINLRIGANIHLNIIWDAHQFINPALLILKNHWLAKTAIVANGN